MVDLQHQVLRAANRPPFLEIKLVNDLPGKRSASRPGIKEFERGHCVDGTGNQLDALSPWQINGSSLADCLSQVKCDCRRAWSSIAMMPLSQIEIAGSLDPQIVIRFGALPVPNRCVNF
jgi:hypothetical protein